MVEELRKNLIDMDKIVGRPRARGVRGGRGGHGGINGDGRRLKLGWRTHNTVYR